MEMGAGSPEQFVSILRVRNAGLSRQEKSLVLASGQRGLKFVDVAANMRRLFGSCDGANRQGVLVTVDADGSLGGDRDQEARATYGRAKK